MIDENEVARIKFAPAKLAVYSPTRPPHQQRAQNTAYNIYQRAMHAEDELIIKDAQNPLIGRPRSSQ